MGPKVWKVFAHYNILNESGARYSSAFSLHLVRFPCRSTEPRSNGDRTRNTQCLAGVVTLFSNNRAVENAQVHILVVFIPKKIEFIHQTLACFRDQSLML